ncbi:MAG TPA: hypothetical protein VF950_16570 [Planctomycetota bacterium]
MLTPERTLLTDKLTVVLGFCELLLENTYGSLEERQRLVLGDVVQAAREVRDLVRANDVVLTDD